MSDVAVPTTQGALFLGGLFATFLSGTVSIQFLIYLKLYSDDLRRTRFMVSLIWLLDFFHTICIWTSLWGYLIASFSDVERIEYIRWDLSLTVLLTALLIIQVHFFFAYRIFLLSKRNWLLAGPMVILIISRFASATATTIEMIVLANFSDFKARFRWLFTLGLALSSAIDVTITVSMSLYLRTNRTGVPRINRLIDSLILYAFETGSLTTAGTIASMICWLVMDYNLVFMGLHFIIAKFYAISLLVALNTRQNLRKSRSDGTAVLYLDTQRPLGGGRDDMATTDEGIGKGRLEINVVRSVEQSSSK
ncbi:hypothetical protein AX16_010974 [Volvariella volvacea WC 439]|nr:hypothetical protein AX16_010974 [Volvariella volvacea WC 439]